MARAKTIRIRIVTSFNGMYAGDVADVPLTERVQGWLNAGVAEVLDGEGAAGSGGSVPDAAGRVASGGRGSGPAGGEPGQGFGAGGYGTAQG